MRFASSLRNLSLGLATATLALAGAAWAQPAASSSQQSMNSMNSVHLVGVNARLDHSLDVTTVHNGQRIEARLNGTVKTSNDMKLRRGTELWGRVEDVHASTNGGPSSMSVVFNTAVLKNGRHVPVKVTILGVYPSNEAQMEMNGTQTIPPPPMHVSSKERIDQEPGLIHHVSMNSAVQSNNSGTFRDSKGNLKLRAGTFLQVGIAPTSTARG